MEYLINVFPFEAKIQIKVSCFQVFEVFHRHNVVDKDEAPYPFFDIVSLSAWAGRITLLTLRGFH